MVRFLYVVVFLLASMVSFLSFASTSTKIEVENCLPTSTGVQTETTTDIGGGLNVGYIDAGDVIRCSLTLPQAGLYKVSYRVASQTATGRFELIANNSLKETVQIAPTGGWQTWTTIEKLVDLPAGSVNLTLKSLTGGWNINWVQLEAVPVQSSSSSSVPTISFLKKVEAESCLPTSTGVQTESTTDIGGGLNVGWIDAGDVISCSLTLPQDGLYKVSYRVAATSTGSFQFLANNSVKETVQIASTGGWQTWTTIEKVVNLPAGSVNLTLKAVTGGWNINWLQLEAMTVQSSSSSSSSVPASAPIAHAGSDQTVKVGSSVTLDGGLSSDADNDIVSYSWNNGFGAGKSVSKVMSQAGTFTISLIVTDAKGNTSADEVTITVIQNQPPTADAGSNFSARVNQANIPLVGSANDADGQIVALKWTQLSGNSVVIANSNSAAASFTPTSEGEYTFELTATDDSGDSASASVTITVLENAPPVANAGADVVITKGESVTFNGAASSDADGSISSYVWTSSAFSSPLTGVQLNFTFPSAGIFSVALTVTDNEGATATGSMSVTVEEARLKRTHETMNLVGTFNSWSIGATTMTLVADFTWQTKINLFETDKLKFVPETWALSYVDNNVDGVAETSSGGDSANGEIPVTEGTGYYLVTFNDQTKAYSLAPAEEPVLDCENGSTNYPRCDNGGLSVVITEPSSLITIGHSPLTVKGTINHSSAILVINGNRVTHSGGVFEADVTVQEGYNTIIASATEGPIAQDTDTISVSLDMTPPYVTVDSHSDGQTISATSITVTGLVNDIVRGTVEAEQAQVRVNNVVAEVSNRSYAAKNVPLVQGTNQIRITASDQVGNTEVKIININNVLPEGNRILLVSGQDQTGDINTVLPQPLVIKLFDENNNPVPNTPVVFRVTQDSGDVAIGTPQEGRAVVIQSDAQGLASTQFRLGLRSGVANNKVKAAAVGFTGDVIFTASATPVLGNKLSVNSGNNQRGVVGQLLPAPLVAVVTDEGANVVKNARVRFESVVGGGTFENAGSIIEVITDSDGRATARYVLGQLEGLDAQHVRATLMDSPKGLRLIAGFSATAFVPADPGLTTVSGIVLDNQETPIPGITMHIEGTTRKAKTDDDGRFVITSAPVGPIHLVADGSTATVAGEFPDLSFRVVTIPGVDNPLPSPIYMVKLNTEEAVYAGREAVDLTLEKFPGFKLEIAKNSVTFPGGAREGFVSVTSVNASAVPMAPPNGMQPQFIVTIQPTGTQFDPPARLSLPNVDAHQPGAQVEMYSYDHDLEEFVAIGLGTVSEDGSVVRSNIEVGVVKAGWHCGSQPGGSGTAEHCADCYKCDGTTCVLDSSKENNPKIEENCEVCEQGKRVPFAEPEECCNKISADVWSRVGATPVCCSGKQTTCVNPSPTPWDPDPMIESIYQGCVVEHEEVHHAHFECKDCAFKEQFLPFESVAAHECEAYKTSVECVTRRRDAECGTDTNCRDTLDGIIKFYKDYANSGSGGTTLPGYSCFP